MYLGTACSCNYAGRALERLGVSRGITKPYQTSNSIDTNYGVRLREISSVVKRVTAQITD